MRTGRNGRRVALAAVALALGAGVGGAEAAAQEGPRQSAELTFTKRGPARPTGVRLAIDYANPADPDGKPHAVARVLERLPVGARIDTTVPPLCGASDAELVLRGAAACPDAVVGSGELDLDTGVPGPLRIFATRVTFVNERDQLVFVVEPSGGGPRFISRAPVSTRSIDSAAPPLPGAPPPDAFTAIRRVRANLHAISVVRGGRRAGYVTTPPACPRSRRWRSELSFTYRDGVTQVVRPATPCVRPASHGRLPRGTGPRFAG